MAKLTMRGNNNHKLQQSHNYKTNKQSLSL
jgi:hypothetical protein